MKRGISKDNIADFAHNAVSSLRRLVTSSYDSLAPFQQDLVTTSRKIEEQWQRSREPVDSGNLSLWAAALAEELRLQLSYGSSSSSGVGGVDGTAFLPPSSRKPLSESGMIASIEAARTVSCYPRSTVEELFCSYDLASLLVKYFVGGPLSKKARDVCAVALVDIAGGSLALEFVKVSLPFLVISSGSGEDGVDGVAASTITTPSKGPASSLPTAAPTPTAAAAAAAEEGAEEREPSAASATAAPVELKPINLLLATVLVSALHRADCINGESSSSRSDSYRQPLLSILKSAYVLVTASGVLGNDAGPSANAETYQVTACTIYLSLASGLLRGNNGSKLAVINGYSLEFYHVWTFAASNLMHMDLFLSVPTNVAGKDAAVALDAVLVWQSELLELLIEVCTDDSFSLRRLFMSMDIRDAGRSGVASNSSNTAHHQQQHHQQQHHHHTDGSGGGLSRYDALPSHWDTLITGGSPMLWRLGTLVSACVFHKDAVPILQGCLMGIDCSVALAESLYRCLIATLMQLCVCNPHNAKILAEASTLQCLIALVTYQQTSVFPPSVTVQLQRRDSEAPLSLDLRPVSHLSTNTTQLTESLMCTLASLYFHKDMLQLTMKAVELMAVQSACQTDADVVESLLHVLACTHNPPRVLFFPGNGSVVCKVDRFAGRWFGYSLSAWINPTCVWAEGSHLFSFTEHSGTSIAICVVANGRSCCLAVRVVTSKEMTVSIIPDSSFAAESWSHIVYTHSIAGISIYVNSRKLESSVSLPFPKEPSKRHRLDLALGGLLGEPSFFGFIASIDLLDGTLSEKEIHRLYANGPGFFVGEAHVPDAKPLISVCRGDHESSSLSTSLSSNPLFMTPVQVTGTLFDKNDGGVSVHGVLSCTSPVMLKVFKECGVMEWALKTLRKSHNALNFAVIAKLCLSFVATAMRMSRGGDAELGDVILADNYLERLKTEVLSWEDTFLDFPSVMLAAATPGGGGKTFRVHHSTQQIFSILLGRLEVVANSTSAATARNSTTLCCILRELSDGLLHAENVALFKSSPERFEQVLSLCLRLPQECIESVVVLLEKLCKAPSELEKTLRFLVLPHPQESKSSADIVKAEILRMLFDIARANVAMCDMIGGFKGCGASFLIMLVHGMNHSSEAIRVFALRLLSLMLHVNRKFRESFAKSHGFQVLSKAIAHPHSSSSSSITIRLPTLDCLFKMAFDSYQPTEKADDAITYRLSSSSSPLAKTKTNKKHRDPATMMLQTPPGGGLSGHLPGLISRRLKVTRREYSFEVAHDFARVDDRLQLDDECRNKAAVSLHAPLAIEAALRALGCLVAGIVSSSAPLPRGATCDQIGRDFLESGTDEQRLMGDAQSTASVTTPPHEDEHPERVVIRVLTYLEKVTDVPANGEALLPYPWLDWLWGAVSPLVSASRRSGNSNNNNNNNNMHHSATLSSTHLSGAGSPTTSSRYPRNFPNDVLMHTRRIIRKLVVLDMTCNRKATTLRRVRGIVQPPVLVRVILEETVRHFARGSQSELSEPTASNVVKNLDFLLRNIEFALDPFPVSLGIEIVTGISAIAVRNNSWVRMRMKNSTHLFETRDRFAGFLLSSTRSFAKVHRDLLFQLLEANASDVTAAAVLLRHLTVAVNSKKVEEVEVVLLLLRQLSSTYEDQRQELYRCCGEPCVALADLCAARDENGGSSSPTEGDADAADSEGGGGAGAISRTASSRDVALPSGGRATPQVIEWSRTHEAEWSALTLSLQRMAKSEESSKAKERAEKEKNVIIKASKARHELREQMEAKVAQEFRRICSDVEAEIGVSHARVGV